MKKLYLLALALLASSGLQARERTQAEKTEAARAALATAQPAGKKLVATSPRLQVLSQTSALTVMGNDALGFAVVSNDDAWPAVIGYSTEPFDTSRNGGLLWFLTTAGETMSKSRRQEPVVPDGNFKPAVTPLVPTLWSQDTPYNDQCPTLTGGNPYPTGCVATALSQIMYYWKYPVHGSGKATLSVTAEGAGGIISVDFGATTYDWDHMLLDYETSSYDDTQAKAVSTLMLHCGVAVGMNYNPTGSGAYSHEARYGMIQYFNYNPGINLLTRNYYSTSEWMKIIYTELNAGRPVYYTGVDPSAGGHAFVCDGYDTNGYLHINWGWGPKGGNGYFDVALLNPTGYSFRNGQNMLVGIAPTHVMDYASHVIGDDALTVSRINKALLNVNGGSMYNLTGEAFTGEIALLMDMGDSLKVLKSIAANNIANYYNVGSLSGMVRLQTSSLKDGSYRLFVGAKSDKDKGWQLVRRAEGMTNSYRMIVSNGDYTLVPVTSDSWATGISRVTVSGPKGRKGVYSLDGRYLGNNTNRLGRGLYVVNGKKMIKK
ncbi:MAG TPA: hypothetical protein DC006_04325 [Prevotellaceae bacterium]|nr:hypothetical protein [Prevotellaceae bacterium]HBN47033.1 hypothetical protein [Prevotella sp.]